MHGLIGMAKATDELANEEEEHKVDLTSPIYQKTVIAAAQERKGEVEIQEEKKKEDQKEQRKKERKEEEKVRTPSEKETRVRINFKI